MKAEWCLRQAREFIVQWWSKDAPKVSLIEFNLEQLLKQAWEKGYKEGAKSS